MTKLHLLILLLFFGISLSSCAQTSFIKKGYAFVAESSPGTEMVDDNGKPVAQPKIVNYTAYVEFTGPAPVWKYAWYKNQFFVLNPTKIIGKKIEIGIDKTTGNKVIIQPAKGNHLWLLELIPAENSVKTEVKPQAGEVILEGTRQKKSFRYRIPKMIALQTPDAV